MRQLGRRQGREFLSVHASICPCISFISVPRTAARFQSSVSLHPLSASPAPSVDFTVTVCNALIRSSYINDLSLSLRVMQDIAGFHLKLETGRTEIRCVDSDVSGKL